MPGWERHFEPETPLMNLLAKDYFRPDSENFPDELSTERIILVGILLCRGNARMRADVFWRVVQEGPTPFIGAQDKDFYPAFQDMVEIGVLILKDFARNQQMSKYLNHNLKLKNVYRMHENFVDKIYGFESRLDREIWIEKVAKQVPWILKPETMRLYAYELLQKENPKDQIFDKPDYSLTPRWFNML